MTALPLPGPAFPPAPLFASWSSLRALWDATQRAARGKKSQPAIARALLDREAMVLGLHAELSAGTWRPGRANVHVIRDPKTRTIAAAPFRDRVVQQALCEAIGPMLDRGLIGDTYACRVGLGTHAALRRAQRWARAYRFAAHLDVRKYFACIDHALLLGQLARDIPCPRTLEVCAAIVAAGVEGLEPARFHFAGDDLFTPYARSVGLPIGHLTSQHFANRYLSPVDHRAKDRLGIRPYLRYMDDLLLFDDDAARLHDHAAALEEAASRLRLRLHPWQVVPTRGGIGYLGFRILPHELRVKRSSVNRAKTRLKRKLAEARARPERPELWESFLASLRSTLAHWAHGDTYRLRTGLLRELGLLATEESDVNFLDRDQEKEYKL